YGPARLRPFSKLLLSSQEKRVIEAREHPPFDSSQRAMQLKSAARPVLQQFDPIVELDQTDAIVWIELSRKIFGRAAKITQVCSHRRRRINHQNHINRHLSQRQLTQRLFAIVFEDMKIFAGQI